MRSLPDRFNDQLENQNRCKKQFGQFHVPASLHDGTTEVDELAELAQHIRTVSHLQVDPGFAQRLEARMLAHNEMLARKPVTRTRLHGVFSLLLRPQLILAVTILVLLLMGTAGVLTAAAQVTDTSNPLYALKNWEMHMQRAVTISVAGRAELDLQAAQDQLTSLTNLADTAHASAYRQALVSLDQQINTFAQSITSLPAGQDQDRFLSKLATLKADARNTLRGLLPQLALSEKQDTTDELGRLGDIIPHIDKVKILVSTHPRIQSTIRIIGQNIQPGARLLIDNQFVDAVISQQTGTYVFTLNGQAIQNPRIVGILNPDGTITQTTFINFTAPASNGNSNGSDKNTSANGNGNANGQNKGHSGKPTSTPTPKH